jgi:hypothetical protein
MVERVTLGDLEFAIIIRNDYHEPGIHFFTHAECSQQLGFMRYPVGHVIEPHVHNLNTRFVHFTREALFLRRGRLRVDFYTDTGQYFESRELGAGDVILLTSGGHGFQVLEEIDMIEVKQGPYSADSVDRRRIKGITAAQARITKLSESRSLESS